MAGTDYCQTIQGFPRIWKFLLTIYTKILGTSTPIKQLVEERYTIQLDSGMPRIIRHLEEKIH